MIIGNRNFCEQLCVTDQFVFQAFGRASIFFLGDFTLDFGGFWESKLGGLLELKPTHLEGHLGSADNRCRLRGRNSSGFGLGFLSSNHGATPNERLIETKVAQTTSHNDESYPWTFHEKSSVTVAPSAKMETGRPSGVSSSFAGSMPSDS